MRRPNVALANVLFVLVLFVSLGSCGDGETGPAGPAGPVGATGTSAPGQDGQNGSSGLVSVAEEPPSENCAEGGQAIHTGIDLDEDGALSADEITETSYVCSGASGEPAFDSLVEFEDIEAGDTCAFGGVRILEGVDEDDDGELDVDEVQGSTDVCAAGPEDAVFPGSFYVRGPGDFAALRGYSTIAGDLVVEGTSLGSLVGWEHVTRIEGSLIIRNNWVLADLGQAPSLEHVGENFFVEGNPALVEVPDFTALEVIGNTFRIVSNLGLETIGDFAVLETLGADIVIHNNPNLFTFGQYNELSQINGVLHLFHGPNVEIIGGFDSLITVGTLSIGYVGATELDGFSGIRLLASELLVHYNPNITDADAEEDLSGVPGGVTRTIAVNREPQEPNEAREDAELIPSLHEARQLMVPGDVDWYQFTVERAASLDLRLVTFDDDSNRHGFELLDLFGVVYDEEGVEVIQTHIDNLSRNGKYTRARAFANLEPGVYTVRVTEVGGPGQGGLLPAVGEYRIEPRLGLPGDNEVVGEITVTPQAVGLGTIDLGFWDYYVNWRGRPVLSGPAIADEALVHFQPDISPEAIESLLEAEGLVAVGGLGQVMLVRSSLGRGDVTFPGELEAERLLALLQRLRTRPEVRLAETNAVLTSSFVPNDPGYVEQWHYADIGLETAWDDVRGCADCELAVLDTGWLRDHEDVCRVDAEYDFWDLDDDATFVGSDHGVHVMGTVGACSDNEIGVAGVDHEATLYMGRVLGPDYGTSESITGGIRWAAGLETAAPEPLDDPAEVINMSLGGGVARLTDLMALDDARAAGSIVVVAAGNDEDFAHTRNYGLYPGVIVVGAVGPDGTKSSFSNYGRAVDIMAPGGEILGRDHIAAWQGVYSLTGDDTESYAFYQGTSMATPHITGIVSLMLEAAGGEGSLNFHDVEHYLAENAVPMDSCPDRCGPGIVDVAATVEGVALGGEVPGRVLPVSHVVWMDDDEDTFEVELINYGDTPVTLEGFVTDEEALTVPDITVPPRETVAWTLTLDREALSDGEFETVIRLTDEKPFMATEFFLILKYRVGTGTYDVGPLTVQLDWWDEDLEEWVLYSRTGLVYEEARYSFAFDSLPDGDYQVWATADSDRNGDSDLVGFSGRFTVSGGLSSDHPFVMRYPY